MSLLNSAFNFNSHLSETTLLAVVSSDLSNLMRSSDTHFILKSVFKLTSFLTEILFSSTSAVKKRSNSDHKDLDEICDVMFKICCTFNIAATQDRSLFLKIK